MRCPSFFFFNDTATTEIYTLSLHDALPIFFTVRPTFLFVGLGYALAAAGAILITVLLADRKSTRLNSSHLVISYAVFCLKKKKQPRNAPISCPHSSAHHAYYAPV